MSTRSLRLQIVSSAAGPQNQNQTTTSLAKQRTRTSGYSEVDRTLTTTRTSGYSEVDRTLTTTRTSGYLEVRQENESFSSPVELRPRQGVPVNGLKISLSQIVNSLEVRQRSRKRFTLRGFKKSYEIFKFRYDPL